MAQKRGGKQRQDCVFCAVDRDRAVQTVYAVIPKRYTPAGGFCRGMEILAQDGGRYRILTPVLCGGFWSLKCSRTWL